MIPVLFRYLCAKPKGEKNPAPIFVFWEAKMPAAPFAGLHVKPDNTERRYEVIEVQWDRHRPEVFTAYVALYGERNPLQPSLELADMIEAGWKLP